MRFLVNNWDNQLRFADTVGAAASYLVALQNDLESPVRDQLLESAIKLRCIGDRIRRNVHESQLGAMEVVETAINSATWR